MSLATAARKDMAREIMTTNSFISLCVMVAQMSLKGWTIVTIALKMHLKHENEPEVAVTPVNETKIGAEMFTFCRFSPLVYGHRVQGCQTPTYLSYVPNHVVFVQSITHPCIVVSRQQHYSPTSVYQQSLFWPH